MASAALKIDPGTEIPGEDGVVDDSQTPRDFDAEAREHGWRPKDEFLGDPSKWVDAEAFVKRADEVMPLLKAQNAKLKRDFDALRKDLKRAAAHFEGAEKRAFDRAKSELETRIEAAIETGDLEGGRAALKEIGELRPVGDEVPQQHTKEEAEEALDAFREEHSWYDKANLANASEVEINARLYFDRMVDKNIERTKELAPADFFKLITDMTLDKYPALKGKPSRVKPTSAVEAGGRGPSGKRGNTFDDLPDGAKRQCDRFVANGIIKTREDYVKTYDWSKP